MVTSNVRLHNVSVGALDNAKCLEGGVKICFQASHEAASWKFTICYNACVRASMPLMRADLNVWGRMRDPLAPSKIRRQLWTIFAMETD